MTKLAVKESVGLHNYMTLKDKFDFGDGFDQFKPKEGAAISVQEVELGMKMGCYMLQKGAWIQADAIELLFSMDKIESVADIAEQWGLSYSTVSARHRTGKNTPVEYRSKLPYTVCAEIATAKFSEDKEENFRIVQETLQKAAEQRMSSQEVRGYIQRLKGVTESVQEETEASYLWIVIDCDDIKAVMKTYEPKNESWNFCIDLKNKKWKSKFSNWAKIEKERPEEK